MRYAKVVVHFIDGTHKEMTYVKRITSTEEMVRFEHIHTNNKYEFSKHFVKYIESE